MVDRPDPEDRHQLRASAHNAFVAASDDRPPIVINTRTGAMLGLEERELQAAPALWSREEVNSLHPFSTSRREAPIGYGFLVPAALNESAETGFMLDRLRLIGECQLLAGRPWCRPQSPPPFSRLYRSPLLKARRPRSRSAAPTRGYSGMAISAVYSPVWIDSARTKG